MTGKQLAKIGATKKALVEAGIDYDAELATLDHDSNVPEVPRISIEHRKNGKHRLFIDYGESYVDEGREIDIPNNEFKGVIFAHQGIRALWNDEDKLPECAGIGGRPTPNIKNPKAQECNGCREAVIREGKCKPKIRLWLLIDRGKDEGIKPFIFALSPVSIKHWNKHKKMMKRSELPIIAGYVKFSLLDVENPPYRYAEVILNIDIKNPPPIPLLKKAGEARKQMAEIFAEISQRDFGDPGDKRTVDEMSDKEFEENFNDKPTQEPPVVNDDLPF